jgi:phasin family protein
MMMILSSPEQVAAAQRASLDAFFGATNKVFETVERLAELNIQLVKSTLSEAQENTARTLSAKDPQEWYALQANFSSSWAEKLQTYSRHLFEIASTTQTAFTQLAQGHYEMHNRRVQSLVEGMARGAPAGSETAMAAWKSAIDATNTLYETLQRTGQSAAQVAESNFNATAAAASKAARRVVDQAQTAAKR